MRRLDIKWCGEVCVEWTGRGVVECALRLRLRCTNKSAPLHLRSSLIGPRPRRRPARMRYAFIFILARLGKYRAPNLVPNRIRTSDTVLGGR